MINSNKEYYLTEVDKRPKSIYCMHDLMGESDIAFHKHEKGQFLYTEGGVVHVITDSQTFFLPARHYMWIPSGMLHSIHPGTANVIMRNLYFPTDNDDDAFYSKVGVYPINELLLQMIIYTNRWSGDKKPVDKSAWHFALSIKCILPEISQYNLPLALPYAKDKRLIAVIKYMENNLHDSILITDFEKKMGLSSRTLSRLFQSDVGMSFVQYLTIQRLMRAIVLLLEQQLSVKEVSSLVGYNSIPTFSNTFYKILGVRPSDYVKQTLIVTPEAFLAE
ncbi:AraC family transcriptional regulator [Flavobacterium tegetincola]|uniref:AraC family transcriptional regulator n=1 Tax=Flavobacterium tegetincola TaxID=150172 RepID=UPI0005586655|nr:AraC family transcriptional regulator [Flavobacterium tegetincola]